MTVKCLHQFFYSHSKYLNSMKCREISMGPSIRTIQCRMFCKIHCMPGPALELEQKHMQQVFHLLGTARLQPYFLIHLDSLHANLPKCKLEK
jgi:hypothetical protein